MGTGPSVLAMYFMLQVRRINADAKDAGKQRLKEVIDSRNNFDIIQHLEQNKSDFKVTMETNCIKSLFQTAVLYLTANNDPESLESILRWAIMKHFTTMYVVMKVLNLRNIPLQLGFRPRTES